MDEQRYRMPRFLDEPPKLLLWTMDEVIAFIVLFIPAVFVFNHALLGLVGSVTAVIGVKRLKGERGTYGLLHGLYWHLPRLGWARALPPSHQRLYRG